MGVDPEIIVSLSVWVVVAGFIGGRAFYVIEYWEEFAGETILETLNAMLHINRGGLVVYGALIAVFPALALFVRKHRLPGLALADLVAPSMALGLALGRVGCFANGCCFGGPAAVPWAVRFPQDSPPFALQALEGSIYVHGLKLETDEMAPPLIRAVEPGSAADRAGSRAGQQVLFVGDHEVATSGEALSELLRIAEVGQTVKLVVADPGPPAVDKSVLSWTLVERQHSLPVHPAQLYAALDALLLCLLLTAFYPYRRRDGEVVALMLTVHPVTRFLIELIRTDLPDLGAAGLKVPQIISLLILGAAAGLWLYLKKQPAVSAFPPDATCPWACRPGLRPG
jgi:phosphatidylglycerol:prolipoprotein diacylglycerol transferase